MLYEAKLQIPNEKTKKAATLIFLLSNINVAITKIYLMYIRINA
jgi:hypothetical protein